MGGHHTGAVAAVKPPRLAYIDYLRVTATVFVIFGHTVTVARTYAAPGTLLFQVLEIFNFIFSSSNLMFLMISGALLLPVRGERLQDFFSHRFSKVLIPMLVYYILYVCAKEGVGQLVPGNWGLMLKRIISGPPVEAPHFWLVYVIIWLYVLTPFLRYLMQNIPNTVMNGVMLVIFLVCAFDTYTPLFGVNLHFSGIVDTFVGVFILGYFIAVRSSRRAENILLAGGIISFFITVYIITNLGWYDDYIYNNAPTMMLFAAAQFVLVKRIAAGEVHTPKVVRLIGKYSYSILLIHWGVLHFGVKQVLHVDVMMGGVWGGCILMAALTFVGSFAGAVILDYTLILWVRKGISAIASLLRSITGKLKSRT